MKPSLILGLLCFFCLAPLASGAQSTIEISGDRLRLAWSKLDDGWHLADVRAGDGKTWTALPAPSGRHTILHIARKNAKPTILCLGDSITAADGGFGNYRKALAAKLGGKAEFVGTKQTDTPAGPLRHDGYSGRNAEFLAQNIERLYRANPADIILLHAGHNHDAAEKPVPGILAATRAIIATAQRLNPRVRILLAQVIPAGKLPKYSYIPELNRELAKLAGTGVIIVNQAEGFDWTKDTVADHVHPTPQGAEKIAAKWYEALQPLLK